MLSNLLTVLNCMQLLGYLLQNHNPYKRFLFIFLCRNSSSGTARSTSLYEFFHPLLIKLSLNISVLSKSFWVLPVANNKREIHCAENLIRHTKISYAIASLVFWRFSSGTYQNGLHWGKSKLRQFKYLRKYELLLGICILVYSYTGCGTSKIYMYLKDNRPYFCPSTCAHKQPFFSACQRLVLQKTKIWGETV